MPLEMTIPPATANSAKGNVLVVDDEVDIREGLELLLTSRRLRRRPGARTAPRASTAWRTRGYDLVLLDLMMPDLSGMEVLQEVRKRDRETPIFLITAYGSVEAAVSALKLGANDYFSKPWDNDKLIIEIDRMIARRRLEYENTHLKRALKQRYAFPNIIGKSESVVRMLDLVAQVSPSRSTILITGETGTGKELVAKAIHANSPRADRMFVRGEQRIAAARSAGIHAFRPCEGRIHQRHPVEEGLFRSGRWRHHFLRRDRHHRRRRRRSSCCACSRSANSLPWVRPTPSRWTCAFWRPPTPTCANW